MLLIEIFYEVDEFCKELKKVSDKNLLTDGSGQRNRAISLKPSEVMAITVYFYDQKTPGFQTWG